MIRFYFMCIESGLLKRLPLYILILLAFGTRLIYLGQPSEVVFDEVYFGKFAGGYFTHRYYFDIHPPLGKLIVAGFAKIAGVTEMETVEETFGEIGQPFSPRALAVLRFMPAFFGAFIALLAYAFMREAGGSRRAAFLVGLLFIFDTALFVQSRFILTDSFLLCFGITSLVCLYRARRSHGQNKYFIWLALAAGAAGFAASIKWTALVFLAIVAAAAFIDTVRKFRFRDVFMRAAILIIVPLALYSSIFVVHLALLTDSGSGDVYMSAEFQKSLRGSTIGDDIKPLPLWRRIIELNVSMYRYNAGITATHPYSSRWYEWPFGRRSVWYWTRTFGNVQGNVYLIANPIVWWLGGIAVLATGLLMFTRRFFRRFPSSPFPLVAGYLLSLLPFIWISRVAFLYHYLPPLLFAILLIGFLYDAFFERRDYLDQQKQNGGQKKKSIFGFPNWFALASYSATAVLAGAYFFYIAPLTYGFFIGTGTLKLYDPILHLLG